MKRKKKERRSNKIEEQTNKNDKYSSHADRKK